MYTRRYAEFFIWRKQMRTDLAKEARIQAPALEGVEEQIETVDGFEIVRIDVKTEQAANELDKPIGRYVSVAVTKESMMDREQREQIARILAKELDALSGGIRNAMVIGLGNRYVSADALGTKTAEYVFVTRHIHMHMKDVLPQGTPMVSAFCANVLGITGMETAEVVSALVEKIQPELVIFIDSLAATLPEHLGCVFQCNDSGIAPGAGVGNFRSILSKDTLGVPVIALGLPLVIGADAFLKEADHGSSVLYDMIVTPKEIDAMVKDASRVLSDAINRMLFGDTYTEIEKLLR